MTIYTKYIRLVEISTGTVLYLKIHNLCDSMKIYSDRSNQEGRSRAAKYTRAIYYCANWIKCRYSEWKAAMVIKVLGKPKFKAKFLFQIQSK